MKTKKPVIDILPGLIASEKNDWRSFVGQLDEFKVTSLALILDNLPADERRALYRQLEGTKLQRIPYVEIDKGTEEWELDYLSTRFKAESFSCPSFANLSGFLSTMPHYVHLISVKGPMIKSQDSGFVENNLRSLGVPGVALDAAAFEKERIRRHANHEKTIAVLDHFDVLATHISVLPSVWSDLMSSQANYRNLSSLKQLRYLMHLPPVAFGKYLVIELANHLDEILEVRTYLESLLKENDL